MNAFKTKLVGPFKQLLTFAELPHKGPLNDEKMPVIDNAGILLRGNKIEAVGVFDDLVEDWKIRDVDIEELQGAVVGMPGLIDAHTHICYGGSRADDYAMRNAGKSYLEIARAGGGIWRSVQQTRNASDEELAEGLTSRAIDHIRKGITTIEVKSGYGLSVEAEVRMLEIIKKVDQVLQVDLVPTCLAAHTLPKDFDGDHRAYLKYLIRELFPILKKDRLTDRIDIFVEETAFNYEPAKDYLLAAKEAGFDITVHADQFTAGGSRLAIEVGAISADHLEASEKNEIDLLAQSDTVAIALPGASLGLGMGFTPARKILDAGGSLAIASDWNPGSAPMGDLLMQAAVLGVYEKLSTAEVLAAITTRAARALNLTDRGSLEPGMLGDFVGFSCEHYKEILYNQGALKPRWTWKNGVRWR
ncbi:imidazolonepropionase [Fulvivirgaceae bacterium BMA12]|uniref:Imidazolonepropionase n=1 Tax=Agaribacillus aureus TaxID=3051825 RepID=A0ABT8LLA9_9BACT|nr:imidazolonepropionase [Fulvivirgaceae bacterium BMA12]